MQTMAAKTCNDAGSDKHELSSSIQLAIRLCVSDLFKHLQTCVSG